MCVFFIHSFFLLLLRRRLHSCAQVAISVGGGEIIYFELNEAGTLMQASPSCTRGPLGRVLIYPPLHRNEHQRKNACGGLPTSNL
jgi:hypothetical protein